MLEIIGTFILIYIIFRVVTGLIIPWLLKRQLNKYKKKYYERNQGGRKYSGKQRNKDVNISIKTKDKKRFDSDNIGEYIDFEEIEDNNKNNK